MRASGKQRGFGQHNYVLQVLGLLLALALLGGWLLHLVERGGLIAAVTGALTAAATIAGAVAGTTWSHALLKAQTGGKREFTGLGEMIPAWVGIAFVVAVAVGLPKLWDSAFSEHASYWLLAAPLGAGTVAFAAQCALGLAMVALTAMALPSEVRTRESARVYPASLPAIAGVGGAVVLVAVFAFALAMPPWPAEGIESLLIGVGMTGGFAAVAAAGAFLVSRFPYRAIAADGDGLWPLHLDRDQALVSWNSIAGVKERPLMQRLELLGRNGEVLLKIEYDLAGFPELRALILEKIPPAR